MTKAYAAAYEEGGGLTLDEATALAEAYRRAHPPLTPPVPPSGTPRGPPGPVQAFLRNLDTASGAITSVIAAAQASVTQTESATGPPIIRPRTASARFDSGL